MLWAYGRKTDGTSLEVKENAESDIFGMKSNLSVVNGKSFKVLQGFDSKGCSYQCKTAFRQEF